MVEPSQRCPCGTRDPFCSTACAREHHGTGTRAERERARKQQMQRHIEDGTDPASLELRRVTVEERQRLIAEGRFVDEFIRAFREHLIAHKEPVDDAHGDVVLAQGERSHDAPLGGGRGAVVRARRGRRGLRNLRRPSYRRPR